MTFENLYSPHNSDSSNDFDLFASEQHAWPVVCFTWKLFTKFEHDAL